MYKILLQNYTLRLLFTNDFHQKIFIFTQNPQMKKIYLLAFVSLSLLFTGCKSNDEGTSVFLLADVTSELLNFTYTPDTGNSTSRLEYQIRFSNPNNIIITGFYRVTIDIDGTESTMLSSADSPCYQMNANSQCTFSFDEVTTHLTGVPTNITFVSAEYMIEE